MKKEKGLGKPNSIFVVKYRLYPTEEQKKFICDQFGACKYIYNRALEMTEEIWEKKKAIRKELDIVDIEILPAFDKKGNQIVREDGSIVTYEKQKVKDNDYCKNKDKEVSKQLAPLYKAINVKNITSMAKDKDGYNWLENGNFDSIALNYELINLSNAYSLFYNLLGTENQIEKPHKKSKKSFKNCYKTCRLIKLKDGKINYDNSIGNVHIDGNYLKVPKLKTKIRMVVHRKVPDKYILKSVAISKYSKTIDEYYAACYFVCYEDNIRDNDKNITHIGLDYSQKTLYVDSENRNANMPRYYQKSQGKLAVLQKKLELYTNGSSRYRKIQKRISKLEQHIKNQRQYFLHNKSKELTENYSVISIENLSMKEQSSKENKLTNIIHTEKHGDVEKNKRFGKETLENGWYEFTRQLEYKQERNNHKLIKINKYYPSSQICSCCGEKNEQMKDLSLRTLTCKYCGCVIDRDYNAAKNIDNEGFRMYMTGETS